MKNVNHRADRPTDPRRPTQNSYSQTTQLFPWKAIARASLAAVDVGDGDAETKLMNCAFLISKFYE